jgi:hypothetical protein
LSRLIVRGYRLRQAIDTFGVPSAFVTKARPSPWLNDCTALLLDRLAEHGMTLPENLARELISDHLDTTARLMRIGRQAAKFYVTDEVISTIADQILGIDKAQSEPNVISLAAERRKRQ